MQFPITIGLHRSRFMDVMVLLVHALAALACVFAPWNMALRAMLLGVSVISVWLAWRALRPCVHQLRLHRDGSIECQFAGSEAFESVDLLPNPYIHPLLTVFRVAAEERRALALILTLGSAEADAFRQFRVWLRWKATVNGD